MWTLEGPGRLEYTGLAIDVFPSPDDYYQATSANRFSTSSCSRYRILDIVELAINLAAPVSRFPPERPRCLPRSTDLCRESSQLSCVRPRWNFSWGPDKKGMRLFLTLAYVIPVLQRSSNWTICFLGDIYRDLYFLKYLFVDVERSTTFSEMFHFNEQSVTCEYFTMVNRNKLFSWNCISVEDLFNISNL